MMKETELSLKKVSEFNWTHRTGPLGHAHSSTGMYDKMECSCAMAASSLRNSVKRTVAKTSVWSTEMALGLGGGELLKILPPSLREDTLLLSESQNENKSMCARVQILGHANGTEIIL